VYAFGNALPNLDQDRIREAVWARPRTPPFCLIIALAHLREAPAVRGVSEPAAVACNAAEVRSGIPQAQLTDSRRKWLVAE
jgi:hypothetical protein